MGDFEESTVLVSGASRGIGRHIALQFARNTDHALGLLARDVDGLDETRRLCREAGASTVEVLSIDLSDARMVQELALPPRLPEVGIIINNAGYFLLKPLQQTDIGEFRGQFASNTETAFNLTQRFLPKLLMLERALVVNICSMSALEGREGSGAYSASKHAMLGYTRSLRLELIDTNVAVTAINLGQAYSTSWDGMKVEPKQLINPDDVGALIVSLSRLSPRTVAEEIILQPQHGPIPPTGEGKT